MPGYGAGVGFFFRNFDNLGNAARLYAVDWLGTGLSGRPKFTARTREQAEEFFISSLAKWKQEVGLGNEPMVLVGHSLGGYLAAAYALARPQDVQHLVLVCPAGVPKAPEDWQQRFLGGVSGVRATMFKAFMWAWEAGVTPHSVIRAMGPWGPRMCEKYVVNRFSHHGGGLSEDEVQWFRQYFYHIVAAQGSGEHALRHLLAPGAWAHQPLADRLRELKVPVTFIYGEADWMKPQHAVDLAKELKQERRPLVSSDLHVEIIGDAGHFVFMDQPAAFNQALLDAVSMHMSPAAAAAAKEGAAQAAAGHHGGAAASSSKGSTEAKRGSDSTTWTVGSGNGRGGSAAKHGDAQQADEGSTVGGMPAAAADVLGARSAAAAAGHHQSRG